MKYFYLGDDFMPGYVTHYIFGRDMYEKLNDPVLKNNLYKNRAVYALGHQGPDIFFYYLPAYVLHGHNLGDMAHTENTGAFYAALLESRSIFKKPEDLQIANAYLEGFLGHYILDSICHPFIYGRTHYKKNDRGYFSRHAYLETEIDTSLLELKYHRRRADFHMENTIMLTPRQKWIVARMLHYAYQHTYHGLFVSRYTIFMAIFATQLGFRILYDGTGQKKVLFRFATTRCYSALILLTCSTKNGRTRGIHPFHLWNLSSISMGGPKKNISIVSLNYLHC